MEKLLLRNVEKENSHTIEVYLKGGGYKAFQKALKEMSPDDVVEEVKLSGLRGRGGAGFPTGLKWEFAAADIKEPKFFVCNADEGEPCTFKDRVIIEKDPHALIEGMLIGAYATGCRYGYIYLRGEYPIGRKILEKAIGEAYQRGFLGENILGSDFSFDLYVHSGAGAYICGEETALIESMEGKRGEPRIKPPFPVNAGYLWKPTVVNNVETLANIPLIIERGGKWYSQIGSPDCPGPKLFPVSGKVKRPGVYELPMGTKLEEIIFEHAGGIVKDRKLKAVFPGGASSSVLTSEEISVPMDFPSLAKAGTMLGSGAIMVLDETDCIVNAALRLIKFFRHESCGKCTPCREGTDWLVRILERIEGGRGVEEDLEVILSVCETMENSFCGLGMAAHNPVGSTVKKFKEEYLAHIKGGKCPFRSS